MAWLVSRPQLDCVRLEMVDDGDGDNSEVVGGVTINHRHLEGDGVLERGIGEVALFLLFLAKVLTKFDLIDRATEESVARRRRVRSVGEGRFKRPAEGVKRSAFRCSMVVVVSMKVWTWQRYCLREVGS
jgi:hypothetical protein